MVKGEGVPAFAAGSSIERGFVGADKTTEPIDSPGASFLKTRPIGLPLLGGEGWGEVEGIAPTIQRVEHGLF